MTSNNILVTGFGPFGEHKVNASWEAVKLLPQFKFDNYNVIVREIPVLYKYIDEEIPILWKVYNPKLVVHVGVSSCANNIMIESQAFRIGYMQQDCESNFHLTGEICSSKHGKDCIQSALDVKEICKNVNANNKVTTQQSTNAGRYLCEFVYYKSLNIDRSRTLFIHVPPIDKPYSAEELAGGISKIINCALEQLEEQPAVERANV